MYYAYDCDCHAGFRGHDCEIDIDECSSSPCVNGRCDDSKNSTRVDPNHFSCTCDDGFEGVTCDTETLGLKDLIDHRPAVDMCRSEVLLFMSFNNDAALNPMTIALGTVTGILVHVLGVHVSIYLDDAVVRASIIVVLGGLLAYVTDLAERAKKKEDRKRKILGALNAAIVLFTLVSQLSSVTEWVSDVLNTREESVLTVILILHQLVAWMLCHCVWSSEQMFVSVCVLCMVMFSTMETAVDVAVAWLGKQPLLWQNTVWVFESMQDVAAVALLVAVTSTACFRRCCRCCRCRCCKSTDLANEASAETANPMAREQEFDDEQPDTATGKIFEVEAEVRFENPLDQPDGRSDTDDGAKLRQHYALEVARSDADDAGAGNHAAVAIGPQAAGNRATDTSALDEVEGKAKFAGLQQRWNGGNGEEARVCALVAVGEQPATKPSDAATGETFEVDLARDDKKWKAVEQTLRDGGDPNAVATVLAWQNPDGKTVLHVAAHQGHVDIVRMLAIHGASLRAQTNVGSTPLHCAAHGGKIDAVRVLLEHGADRSLLDHSGRTALVIAETKGETKLAELLRQDRHMTSAYDGR